MIDRVIYELTNYYRSKDRELGFKLLQPFLGWDAEAGASYAEIGRELGISESNVKVKVHRMRSRCRALLKAEVGRTLACEDESTTKQELPTCFRRSVRVASQGLESGTLSKGESCLR